jgi:hypothetical protein
VSVGEGGQSSRVADEDFAAEEFDEFVSGEFAQGGG